MIEIKEERMAPPPAGTTQAATLGDAPLNAKDDYPAAKDVVYVVCCLQGDWPGANADLRERGIDLGAHYVRCLYEMVSRLAPSNTAWRFICFTDRPGIEGVPCRPMARGLWGYFCKLYLFGIEHYPVGARVLYLDLDTVLLRSWGPLAGILLDDGKLVMLRDVMQPDRPAAGIMSWRHGKASAMVWNDFMPIASQRPPYRHRWPRKHQLISGHGSLVDGGGIRTDEQWLYHYTMPDDWHAWQDLLPGMLASYKYDVIRTMRRDPSRNSQMPHDEFDKLHVVYFHGHPRPHAVVGAWNPIYKGLQL